jgi:hypothetical protein
MAAAVAMSAGAGAGAGAASASASTSASTSSPTLHIVFHGNCIDGWLSAYIASGSLRALAANAGFPYESVATYEMWAISPNQAWTWKRVPVEGCHVLLLDVSLPEEHLKAWESAALSVHCIDHHASNLPQWSERETKGVLKTEHCATWLTWGLAHPGEAVPDWVALADRIDLWTGVTAEDRALREVLYPLAVLAVRGLYREAFEQTRAFIAAYEDPEQRALQVEQGQKEMVRKDLAFKASLERQPTHLLAV